MSAYVHHTQISQPELLDVVDDEWAQDRLPDDGVLILATSTHMRHSRIGHRMDCRASRYMQGCVLPVWDSKC
jgi:hypothetical protein